MKTTTNTVKFQKCIRKVLEEIVGAIRTIGFSLKTLAMIHWTSSRNQPELTFLGQSWKILKGIKIAKKQSKN